MNRKKFLKYGLFSLSIGLIIFTVLWFANIVSDSATAQAFVSQFGYLGVTVIAIVAGLNAFVPVPAATFVPVFEAAGMVLPLLIVALVIGTTIADLIGYLIGRVSRELISEKYPETFARILNISEHHRFWLLPIIFGYSAFVPFPNEAMLIPLALAGVKLRVLFIPLVLGTVVNQAALAYGFSSVFALVF